MVDSMAGSGGAFFTDSDSVTLVMSGCQIVNSRATNGFGGALHILGGHATLMNECTIVDTSARLTTTTSPARGAAIAIIGGRLTATGLLIEDSHAVAGGGAVAIDGGRVVLTESRIRRTFERAFRLAGGELHLVRSIVERSEASPPS